MSADDTTLLLLQAYVDGELDAAASLSLENRLKTEPELVAARTTLMALRRRLRENAPLEQASERLHAAVAAIGSGSTTSLQVSPIGPKRLDLRRSADIAPARRMALAACLVGALAGSVITTAVLTARAPMPVIAEVVADHLRAVMAPQPFDVASSDQHTVKPWFLGRVPFAPKVFDLTPAGYTLVGGRVDVLGGQAAATLVFRHGKHLISLLSQPVGTAIAASRGAALDRGFLVRDWVSGNMHYWAVSDVAPNELDTFETAARAQTAAD